MNPKTMMKSSVFLIIFLCLFLTAERSTFAQCGNYFKTNYRAVNKIGNLGNDTFLLDDWTGDGRLDFWALQTNTTTSTKNILIYPGKTTGYWDWDNPIIYTTTIPASASMNASLYTVKDFNADGRIDFRFRERIYRNNGNGTLTGLAQITTFEVNVVERIGFYDLNGDGLLDFLDQINSPTGGNSLSFYAGNADGSFGQSMVIYTGFGLGKKLIADYNGDGKLDIAFGENGSYRILQNSGNGVFSVGNLIQSTNGVTNFIDTKDFNRDGKADIVALGGSPKKLVIFYGQANGTFTETAQTFNTPDSNRRIVVELSGDNNPDLIEVGDGAMFYNVYINNGTNGFSVTTYPTSLGTGNSGSTGNVIFSDFSGDGKADIYDVSNNTFNVFGEQVVFVKENVCQSFGETRKINFDGNPVGELATWNPTDGVWSSGNFDSQGFPGGSVKTFNWGLGSLGDVPALGDFDGDGKTDYTVYRNSTGYWYSFLSSNSSWMSIKFGLTGDVPVPNDYDGGGKTDFAVFRPSDGNWYIWYSETQTFGALHFGSNEDKPVPSDYDGDGKTDIAVYRPSAGNWYYLKSSDSSFSAIHWGVSTDIPVPADYDGDGKSDLTVFRNGTWFVLRSSNNAVALLFGGTATDIPLPFYYGEMAKGVFYNPSTKAYYSTSPVAYIKEFLTASDVPVTFGLPNK